MTSVHRAAWRIAAGVLLLAAAGACARASHTTPPAAEAAVRSDSIVVRVANHSDRVLTLDLSRAGSRSPLGEVPAGGHARFVLRADAATGSVALVATASHESMQTVPFRVRGGQVVWFEIAPGLVGSRVVVRWPEEGPPR